MSIPPDTRLGPYQIQDAIGAGGMGEVYRARDTRLQRDVAVKVLPAAVAADPDRLRRFEQEARAAAALNHPNILAVFDVGTDQDINFVVAELLDGETLRSRVSAGALPVAKAVDFALQMALGLAAAHAKGIVHRDLKPENLFVTSDGRVKILDFGLAKLEVGRTLSGPPGIGGTAGSPDLKGPAYVPTESPTRPGDTTPGAVLGTLGYMAPEQVRGVAVDHRADLFAFGAVLHEMLTGQRAFAGDTAADTMTAILVKDPPPLVQTNRAIPPALDRLVRHCLEKPPDLRFQSARDVAFALEGLLSATDADVAGMVVPATSPSRSRERLAWSAALVVAALLIGVGVWRVTRPEVAAPRPVSRFSLEYPASPDLLAFNQNVIALSQDGTKLAYVGQTPSVGQQLYLRSLDQLDASPLRGTEDASGPFFSPDGAWIGFFADGKLRKVPISGGSSLPLADAPAARGASWSTDDTIVFAPRNGGRRCSGLRAPAAPSSL